MLSYLAAGFILINSTTINTDQVLALEATPDQKACYVHMLSKNPFEVKEPCIDIQRKIELANSKYAPKDNYALIAIAGLVGILIGGVGGIIAGRNSKKA